MAQPVMPVRYGRFRTPNPRSQDAPTADPRAAQRARPNNAIDSVRSHLAASDARADSVIRRDISAAEQALQRAVDAIQGKLPPIDPEAPRRAND